ncbi:MAG: hypothetical protein GX902_06735 [Lentisphaerae bacterium]|nr:hypothetical protein [Lentisphaerota bacterium]
MKIILPAFVIAVEKYFVFRTYSTVGDISQRCSGRRQEQPAFPYSEYYMGLILAYIDAGTGSIILQASLAGVFATAFFFRQLKSWFQLHCCHRKISNQSLSDN